MAVFMSLKTETTILPQVINNLTLRQTFDCKYLMQAINNSSWLLK